MLLQSLLALVFALHGAASPQLSPDQPRYSLHGTVVNSATGEPIRRALVQVYVERERSQLTGDDGQFLFEGVPAGNFGFRVQKPGYFSPQEIGPRRMEPNFIIVGPDQAPAILKLIPEGIVYGRISGEDGEPLENFPVQLSFDRIENGKKTRTVGRSGNTNEEGQFRLPELLPGKYFLFVGPSVSPVSFPQRSAEGRPQGYGAVFYPGVPDASSATPIEVAAGKQIELNLALRPQPFYRIAGTLSGYAGSNVSLQFFNAAGQPIAAGFEFDAEKGTFRSPWMAPGPVTIRAFSHNPQRQQNYSASQTVNITSDSAGVHLTLVPNLTIPVNMRVEKTHNDSVQQTQFVSQVEGPRRVQDNAPARAMLVPAEATTFRGQYGSEPIGTDENRWVGIRNVQPGTYSLQIFPNGPYYVQSARLGSSNLLEEELKVAAAASIEAMEIVLRDDGATLTGTVSSDHKRAVASVLAVPVSNPGPVQFTITGAEGEFQFVNMAPGSYRLIAADHAADWEYNNPEVLRKYLPGAREVSVGPNQSVSIDLEVVRIQEPAP